MIRKFGAVLENPEGKMDIAYITIPFKVQEVYGAKGKIKVKATFDGYLYRGVLSNMGTGSHVIGVRKDVRAAIGKQVGDRVDVTIEKDEEERVVDLPVELKKLLEQNTQAGLFFNSLSFTNRKEYVVWVSSAKKEETRQKRLKEIIPKLLAGKRNPSEK